MDFCFFLNALQKVVGLWVGLGNRGPLTPHRGLLTPPLPVDTCVLQGVPATCCLIPRTDAVGAGGAADVVFTELGFLSPLGRLGPLLKTLLEG